MEDGTTNGGWKNIPIEGGGLEGSWACFERIPMTKQKGLKKRQQALKATKCHSIPRSRLERASDAH